MGIISRSFFRFSNQTSSLSFSFADCQSSEMFFLSLEERVKIGEFVKKHADGRVPVVTSGHISDSLEDQAKELTAIAGTGADAVILLTNRLAKENESDEVWLENLKKLLFQYTSLPAYQELHNPLHYFL